MATILIPQMQFIYQKETADAGFNEKNNQASLNSLEAAFENDLAKRKATAVTEKTYYDNTAFLYLNGFCGSGLLLTADGWLATASHCIEQALPKWDTTIKHYQKADQIKSDKNLSIDSENYFAVIGDKRYPIDIRYHAIDREHDIALIKVRGQKLSQKIIFPWKESKGELISPSKNYSQINLDDAITLYSKKDNLTALAHGTITSLSEDCNVIKINILDTIGSNGAIMHGYSGGAVTSLQDDNNPSPALLGFSACMYPLKANPAIGHANITKADYLIELIDRYLKDSRKIIDVETRQPMAQLPHSSFVLYEI